MSEGLITDDMSERIVTSLPKCLSDSTMRGSRDSLRSIASSTDSLCPATSCDDVAASTNHTSCNSHVTRRRRRHWKLLKLAVSKWLDAHTRHTRRLHPNNFMHK